MRLALDQGPPATGGSAAALARLDRAANTAAAAGADLLIVPEMALTGYNIGAASVRALAEPLDGPMIAAIARIALRHRIALLAGFPELGADGRVYNAAHLVDKHGYGHATCRKTHLFGAVDRTQFAPGAALATPVELDGWRLGLAICYDIEFPELARAQAIAGVDAILVPTANMLPFTSVPTRIVPARAEENEVYVAYANYCGAEGEFIYCGLSCVCGPDGADLARAGSGEEMIFADLSKQHLAATRAISTHLADRRPELYKPAGDPKDAR
jgi:predicted amidohydrolase